MAANSPARPARLFFGWAVGAELSLLAVAAGLHWLWPWFRPGVIAWNPTDAVLGLLAAGPLLVGFGWTLRSAWPPLAQIRDVLDTAGRQLLGGWAVWQLGLIAVLAGVCEETLFRGALQGGLSPKLGPVGAVAVASLLFGLCHAVNRAYAVAATVLGAWLGGLYALTGNLLVPVLTHGLYDFVALLWLLRWRQPPSPTASAQPLGPPTS